jgi:hypothetical protein
MKPEDSMKNISHNQKGSTIITFSVIVGVLILVIASAIGLSRYDVAKTTIQKSLDNALLSGVALTIATHRDVTTTVQKFMNANIPTNSGITVTSLTVTNNGLDWTATVTASINSFSVFDSAPITVHQTSTVQWAMPQGTIETVFTFNTSTSMCQTEVNTPQQDGSFVYSFQPDPTCTKLNWMKNALDNIVAGLAPIKNVQGTSVYRVGIVPYNHKILLPVVNNVGLDPTTHIMVPTTQNVPIPSPLASIEASNPKGWSNNEGKTAGSTYYTDFSDAWPLPPVLPLTPINTTGDQTTIENYINNIQQQITGQGWVRSDTPALTAALMLDPGYLSSFNGQAPAAFTDKTAQKIVVLMADGANVGCCFSDFPDTPTPNFNDQYLYTYEGDNAGLTQGTSDPSLSGFVNNQNYGIPTLGICDQLKQQGVTVYAVLLDLGANDVGAAATRAAYQSCATNPQYFFDVTDQASLQLAFQTVTESLVQLRIIK